MRHFGFLERLQTIAATATVTSALWIVVGTVYLDRGPTEPAKRPVAASAASPAPAASLAPERANAAQSADGNLAIPVLGVAAADLVDTFGEARGERRHQAIDVMAPAGTAVVAAAPGTVEKLFVSAAGGNSIYVRSNDRRTIHYYAHLQSYASGLAEGQTVRRGQRLGAVGSTGNADPAAPHLHFQVLRIAPDDEWWEATTAVNPYPLLVRAIP